jgi:hypothetical protein
MVADMTWLVVVVVVVMVGASCRGVVFTGHGREWKGCWETNMITKRGFA